MVPYHTIYRDGDIQCIFVSPYQDVSECMTWPCSPCLMAASLPHKSLLVPYIQPTTTLNTMKHFINLDEFDAETLKSILKKAHELKAQKFEPPQLFKGLTL